MSVELLRSAAAKMRETAQAVTLDAGRLEAWEADVRDDGRAWLSSVHDGHMVACHGFPNTAVHIASWHPAVALAVADLIDGWLSGVALLVQHQDAFWDREMPQRFISIARAYLGEEASGE